MKPHPVVERFNALQGRLRISVTHNCQLHCRFCHQEGIERHWITTANIDRKQLKTLVASYAQLGGQIVELTGGEPTIHPDISGLIDAIAELKRDLRVILCTNGLRLDKVFDKIKQKKLDLIRLSFHATDSSPDTKQLLGNAWDVERLEQNVKNALQLGARFQLIFTHSGKNTHHLPYVLEKANQWNVDIQIVDLIRSRAGRPDQELGYRAGSEARAVVNAYADYVQKITDRTGAVLELYRSRQTGREWEIKDYHFGVLHSDMCADCKLRSTCGEGIYALRVDATGIAKPCLLREDLQQKVDPARPREVQRVFKKLLDAMLSGSPNWTYDITLPPELTTTPPALSADSLELANEIYKQLSPNSAAITSVPYGRSIWKELEIQEFDEAVKRFEKPVGLVLRGVLEVSEEFLSEKEKVLRFHTTALIKPGNLFGLFEACGLRGTWQITSGVTRFLIVDTRMGTNRFARHFHLSSAPDSLRRTLLCQTRASFDYRELFTGPAHREVTKEWFASVLMFDLERVSSDTALFSKLQARTIQQLKSLIYQNPPEGIWFRNKASLQRDRDQSTDDKEVSDLWDDQENVRHTGILGAMLQGDIPLFRLARPPEDEAMLPVQKLIDSLYRDSALRPQKIPIFLPDYMSPDRAGEPFLYINALSNVLNLRTLQNIFRKANEQAFVTPTGLKVSDFRWLDAAGQPIDGSSRKLDTNTPFRVKVTYGDREFLIQSAQEMIVASTTKEGKEKREAKYRAPAVDVDVSWPDHIKNMLVIKEQPPRRLSLQAVRRGGGASGD